MILLFPLLKGLNLSFFFIRPLRERQVSINHESPKPQMLLEREGRRPSWICISLLPQKRHMSRCKYLTQASVFQNHLYLFSFLCLQCWVSCSLWQRWEHKRICRCENASQVSKLASGCRRAAAALHCSRGKPDVCRPSTWIQSSYPSSPQAALLLTL